MQAEADYRTQAGQCVREAQHAKNPAHRSALLHQAETLLRMADEAARMEQSRAGDQKAS